MKTVHLLIIGKVQGVFFRATASENANSLGLKGWVANTEANSVEMIVTGEPEPIEKIIEWCHKGPVAAKVEEVNEKEIPLQTFNDFIIKK